MANTTDRPVQAAPKAKFDRKAYAAQLVRRFAKKGELQKYRETVLARISKNRKLRASTLSVAINLMPRINKEKGYAYTGIKKDDTGIAAMTGLSFSTVMRALSQLEEEGHLYVHRSRTGKKNNVNEYYFFEEPMIPGGLISCDQGGLTHETRAVSSHATRVVSSHDTLSSYLNQKEHLTQTRSKPDSVNTASPSGEGAPGVTEEEMTQAYLKRKAGLEDYYRRKGIRQ